MAIHHLSFAQMTIIQQDLAEIVVNEGVEMNVSMVREYAEFLKSNLVSPYFILVNRLNSYSYTFNAQQLLSEIEGTYSFAITSYNRPSTLTSELMIANADNVQGNVKLFSDREAALAWLLSERASIKSN